MGRPRWGEALGFSSGMRRWGVWGRGSQRNFGDGRTGEEGGFSLVAVVKFWEADGMGVVWGACGGKSGVAAGLPEGVGT